MERVHGTEPSEVPTDLAEQLARLHQAQEAHVPDLPQDGWRDPWRVVDDLAERGYLDLGTARWSAGWFTRLDDRFDRDEPKVLIHGDVAAHNLLATPGGELATLIDWGDAAYAPRAMDFAKLPLEHVAAILPTTSPTPGTPYEKTSSPQPPSGSTSPGPPAKSRPPLGPVSATGPHPRPAASWVSSGSSPPPHPSPGELWPSHATNWSEAPTGGNQEGGVLGVSDEVSAVKQGGLHLL